MPDAFGNDAFASMDSTNDNAFNTTTSVTDNNNKDGGSFSYKISNHLLEDVWKKLVYALLGNTLTDDENILKNINGISISPKKNYCIIKLWLANIENFKNTSLHEFINNSIKTYEFNKLLLVF